MSSAEALPNPCIQEVERFGQPYYLVETEACHYLYDPVAGGFSSIVDRSGNDWIAFKKEPWHVYPDSTASSFRGLPNLVHKEEDGGVGHPGFEKCQSEIIGDATLRTSSLSGKWQWTWDFNDDYAELEIERMDESRAYWFLYEGPVGGRFNPSQLYCGSDRGAFSKRTFWGTRKARHKGKCKWFYFGANDCQQAMWMAQSGEPIEDSFKILGADSKKGLDSPDGMMLAGFGRTPDNKPLFRDLRNFYIGFVDTGDDARSTHRKIAPFVEGLLSSE